MPSRRIPGCQEAPDVKIDAHVRAWFEWRGVSGMVLLLLSIVCGGSTGSAHTEAFAMRRYLM